MDTPSPFVQLFTAYAGEDGIGAHLSQQVAAEVDAALLGDDLPINAYRDPGFVEYLKAPPGE